MIKTLDHPGRFIIKEIDLKNPFNPFMTEAVIIYKPVHGFAEQFNGLFSI